MAKAQLGTKRICPNCGARYYDLNHNPIICPRCGTRFEVAAAPARSRAAPPKIVPAEVEVELDVKDPVEVVSLEEADDEAAAAGAVKVEGGDDDEEEIEKEEEDDTFLAEEDEEDDVENIIGDVNDEET